MRAAAWILAASLFLPGCGASAPDGPPDFRYGRDACAECRMIVSDAGASCALVAGSGEVFKFDDLGCMKIFEKRRGENFARVWVQDRTSAGWIDGKAAFFVVSGDLVTPMGYGATAFATRGDAERFRPGGGALSWEELDVSIKEEGA